MDEIEKSFQMTSKLIFGESLSNLDDYFEWMERRIPKAEKIKSIFSDKTVPLRNAYFFPKIPKNKIAVFDELLKAGEYKISNPDNISIENIKEKLKGVAYFVPDFQQENNRNVVDSTVYIGCINVRNSIDTFWLKNSAHDFSAFGEGLFGSYRLVNSKFSIHCYNVVNITSCFELDTAKNCSNAMFCHNVENIHDSLFCFNTKSKRYAVANIEVGQKKFFEFKKLLLEKIISELKTKKWLEMDIYNVLEQR